MMGVLIRSGRAHVGRALLVVAVCLPSWGCATGGSDAGFGNGPGYDAGPSGQGPDAGKGEADSSAPDAGSTLPATDSGSTAPPDSAAPFDSSQTLDSGSTVIDSGGTDSTLVAVDSGVDLDSGAADGGPTGLDPLLDLPAPSGAPCSTPGLETRCPALEVCRIDSATGGRCEGCTSCNNLGKPCSQSSDCDILFQCYAGVCANICPLGTQYCGAVTNCLDVGNATYGVCRPQ
jgi:hypothetical protein